LNNYNKKGFLFRSKISENYNSIKKAIYLGADEFGKEKKSIPFSEQFTQNSSYASFEKAITL